MGATRPIPQEWGLNCPTCGYSLTGLMKDRCPECGTDLDVQSLLEASRWPREPRNGLWIVALGWGYIALMILLPMNQWVAVFLCLAAVVTFLYALAATRLSWLMMLAAFTGICLICLASVVR